jgi:RNA recognition motif-containing protein
MQLLLLKEPTHLPLLQHREHYIDGRKVDAKAAVPRDQGGGKLTRKMFVGGIGEVSDAEFQAHFANFGTVTVRSSDSAVLQPATAAAASMFACARPGQLRCIADPSLTVLCCALSLSSRWPRLQDCVVLRKPDGGSRGFGFVTFDDEVAVEKCLVMEHHLAGRRVDVKRAVGKDEAGGGLVGGGGGGGGGGFGDRGGSGMHQMGGGGGGRMGGGGQQPGDEKMLDWNCAECGNTNYGWRHTCNRCGLTEALHCC